MRTSRKVHSKCTCSKDKPSSSSAIQPLAPSSKVKRYMPIAPALPNGLKDILQPPPTKPADSRQLVHSLLNPCTCKNLWACKCPAGGKKPTKKSSNTSSETTSPKKFMQFAPDLPPILLTPDEAVNLSTDTPLIPPLSAIASFAGSGCTCGVECSCPGCEEHRGPAHVDRTHRSCSSGCNHCVDSQMGIALPGLEPSPTVSMIDQFLRRAASLPAPPPNRRMGIGADLDPANVMTYPRAARDTEERAIAFGLISLPKLECCAGKCACAADSCHCGDSCNGSCAENNTPALPRAPPARSCCASKA